jgi:hypothetical protein
MFTSKPVTPNRPIQEPFKINKTGLDPGGSGVLCQLSTSVWLPYLAQAMTLVTITAARVIKWSVKMDRVKVDDSLRPRMQINEKTIKMIIVMMKGVNLAGNSTSAAR